MLVESQNDTLVKGVKMANIIQRFKKRWDQYQVKLTFAEAGVAEEGEKVVEQEQRWEKAKANHILLVVGNAGAFSQEIIDYSLDMAKRMDYEILALSTSDLSCETFSLFPDSKSQMCTDFNLLAEENSKLFASKAEDAGLRFTHQISYDDVDTAIDSINRKIGDVSFVVNEQLSDMRAERNEERPESRMFVYSVI